jgi:excisionase family DNA binding protein
MIPWRERARLRPRELAELAGVSVRTIFRAIERRELGAIRVGRCTFIPIAAALDYVGELAPAAAPPGRSVRVSEEARRFVAKLREACP